MKLNFRPEEVASVIFDLGDLFNVSINKSGNIKLRWKVPYLLNTYWDGKGEKYYTFYKNDEGIILRAMTKTKNGISNVYPLNMKRTKEKHNNYTYWGYNIKDSYFNNIEDALEFFNNYIEKYYKDHIAKCEVA